MMNKDDNNLPDGLWDDLILESTEADEGIKDRVLSAGSRLPTPSERFRNRLTTPFWLSFLLTFFCIYLYDHQFWMSTYELFRGIFVSLLVGFLSGDLFFVHAKRWLKVLLWLSAIALGAPILYSALVSALLGVGDLSLSLAEVFNSSPILYPKGLCYLALAAFALVQIRSRLLHSYVPWYEPNRASVHRRGLAFLGVLLMLSPLVLSLLLYQHAPSQEVSNWIARQSLEETARSRELQQKLWEAPDHRKPKGGTVRILSPGLGAEILDALEKDGHLAFSETNFWLSLEKAAADSGSLDSFRYWIALHNITDRPIALWYPSVDLSVFADPLKHDYSLSVEQLEQFEESLLRLGEHLPSESEALESLLARKWSKREIYLTEYPTSFFSNNILNELDMNPLIHFKRAKLYSVIEMWLALQDSNGQGTGDDLSFPESRLLSSLYAQLSDDGKYSGSEHRYRPKEYREYVDALIAVCRIRRFNLTTRRIPQPSEVNFDDLPSQVEIRYTELRDRTAITVDCGKHSFGVYTKS